MNQHIETAGNILLIFVLVAALVLFAVMLDQLRPESAGEEPLQTPPPRTPRTVMEDRQELLRCLDEHGEALISTGPDGRRVIECPVP